MSDRDQSSLRKRIAQCLRIIFKKNNAEGKQTLHTHSQQECLQENETLTSCKLPHHVEDHKNTTSTSSTGALNETTSASTQTTPTPLSEQLARRMSNRSLQEQHPEQHPEQPSRQTQGTTTANTAPTFCQPCQKARAKPNYGHRVAALLDPLYCSKCYVDHPAIFFSESQRKVPESGRICIGFEGYCTVCPHLKFSLQDSRDWLEDLRIKENASLTMTCQEKSCKFNQVAIQQNRLIKGGSYSIQWSSSLDIDSTDIRTRRDGCLAKLKDLHTCFPGAFCPHLQTTPDRLTCLKSFSLGNPCHRPAQQRMSCRICRTRILCDPLAKDSDPPPANPFSDEYCSIERTCEWSFGTGGATQEAWTSKLNPESYGHFVDQDTKHITWCDDRRCTTTFELIRYASLLELGTNQLEEMRETLERDSACGVGMLDNRTNWNIGMSLGV
ncbi:hypothetical protein BKA56DRAFT_609159 [Ilyonectria sp. MPI-CAGE-AT-0026]|nr:hypothetical protein BKA56DRAFT_609159 [Ilyonectria sp. MPI-CAGE-AT-0026]